MKRPVGPFMVCALAWGGMTTGANAAPYFLGDQEVAADQIAAVQSHCELLADEHAAMQAGEDANGDQGPAEAFVNPPMGLGDVGDDEAESDDGGAGEAGTSASFDADNGDSDRPDFSAIDMEDCKGAGLIN